MSLLAQLDMKNDETSHLSTILAIKEHPASAMDLSVRDAYLKCVYLVCYADKIFHEYEINMLEDLAKSLGLSRKQIEGAKEFAYKPSDDALEKTLDIIKKSNIEVPCMMDMFILSYSDGQLCKEESQFIYVFAKHWEYEEEFTNDLKKLSNAVYNGQREDALRFFTDRLVIDNTGRENLKLWLEAVLETTIAPPTPEPENVKQPAPPIKNEPTITVDTQINSKLVTSLQREISSQLGKLQSLLSSMDANKETPEITQISSQIEEEKQKIKDLRLTLAFVGTMKAGKSTTINAVVGANVLPNRSGAMTTMPTLVTHVPGCLDPVLHFRKNTPFTDAIKQIRKIANKETLERAKGALYEETLTRIATGNLKSIDPSYTGRQGIYDFMLAINDISRICEDLAVENPLNHYSGISDFPEIEVEFAYLSDRANDSHGRLTLIDTPGPNEAGQGHLKGVVKEQLAKASAIVCVVDPTQADSEAQAEIREWLQGAQKKSGAELFVLINKVDTVKKTERRSDLFEAKALRLFPDFEDAAGEMKSIRGNVFGVSSQQALLSNMVSRTIAIKSSLPDYEEEPWVADFLEKAYGTCWEDYGIGETDRHKEQGNRMWERSGMQSPMEKLIAASLHQAVPLCFGAALRMVATRAESLKQEARLRWKSLNHEITVLEAHLARFKESAEKLDTIGRDAEGEYGAVLKQVKQILSNALIEAEKKNIDDLETLVKKRRKSEQQKTKVSESKYSIVGSIFDIVSGRKKDQIVRVFDENAPIVFDNVDEAQKFICNVMQPFQDMTRRITDKKVAEIEVKINEESQNLGKAVENKLTPVISQLNRELNKDFEISLKVPNPRFPKIDLDLDIATAALVRTETRTEVYYERSGWTLWLIKHRHEYTVTEHQVEPQRLREKIKEGIRATVKQAGEALDRYISDSFQKNVSNYLGEVSSILKRMNGALADAIATRQNDAKDQANQKEHFLSLEEAYCSLAKRSTDAQTKLKEAMGEQV